MIASLINSLLASRIRGAIFLITPLVLIGLICKMVLGVSGYQDSETLLGAANFLSLRLNPYENPFFLNGYILAPLAHILSSPFSQVNGARIYVIFNLALLALLVWDLCRNLNSKKIFIIIFVVLTSSPTRAMAASVQHTGLILASSYFSYKIGFFYQPYTKASKFLKYTFLPVLLLIPIELKPQLMLPLIAVFLSQQKLRIHMISCLALGLILHLSLSFYLRMPLDKYWLMRLLHRSSETTGDDSRENSPWTLLGIFVGHPRIWLGLSSLIFLTLVIGLSYLVKSGVLTQNYFLFSFSIPLFLSYIHPYDLILSIIVVASLFVKAPAVRGSTFLLPLFLLPTIGTDRLLLLFSLSIFLLIWLTSEDRAAYLWFDFVELVLSLAVYLLFTHFTRDIGLRVNIHMSILIVGTLILIGLNLVIPVLKKSKTAPLGFIK